jgi:hypothetical protein
MTIPGLTIIGLTWAYENTRADSRRASYCRKGDAMNELKKLQNKYKAGKLTKEQYEAAVKELLNDEELDQEAYDEALEYDPKEEGGGENLIYSQEDVNQIVLRKGRSLVKKVLRDAGVDLTGVENKDLMAKLTAIAKTAVEKGNLDANEQEISDLRAASKKLQSLEANHSQLEVENAVLKAAGKYNPVNPSQVVRALNYDYKDLLEFDDDNQLVAKSVDKALKRVAEAEPNLFKAIENQEGGAGGTGDDDKGNFSGKGPGGAAAGGGGSDKDKKYAANKSRAMEMLGLVKKDQ